MNLKKSAVPEGAAREGGEAPDDGAPPEEACGSKEKRDRRTESADAYRLKALSSEIGSAR